MKLFKSHEKAKEEVDKLKQQLYPNLGIESEGGGDSKTLNTIIENESDYTSEAIAESDDEVRPSEIDDDVIDDEEENSQMDDPKSEENKVPEKSEEDLAFEAMFEKMSVDSYQERIKEVPKISTRDIPLPLSTKSIKKTYEQLQETTDKPEDSVPFVLMVRNLKSGKQQFKSFAAPSDSELAVNLKVQEQKVKEEHEKVKRLTLNITERLEEEDYQESLQRSPAPNRIRPKVQKFKHQKGVPDIDF